MPQTSRHALLTVAAFAHLAVPRVAPPAGHLAAAGITAGCSPPANDRFCPSNNVTREQISAFVHRLAVDQVVDAATLDGLDSTQVRSTAASVMLTPTVVSNHFAPMLSIAAFDAPAGGGVLLIDASTYASRQSVDQVGTTWIEVDMPGVCDMGILDPGYGMYAVTAAPPIESVSVTGAVEVTPPPRIDLCHEIAALGSTWLTAQMNVQWVPVVDGAGVDSVLNP